MIETVGFEGARYRGTFTGERVENIFDGDPMLGGAGKTYCYVGVAVLKDAVNSRGHYLKFSTEDVPYKVTEPIKSLAACVLGIKNSSLNNINLSPEQFDRILGAYHEEARGQESVTLKPPRLEELLD